MSYNPARDIVPCKEATRYKHHDNMTESGARELAADLNAWWHSKGPQFSSVCHWVEFESGRGGRHPTWTVKSNLVNGLPPR